MHRVTFRLPEQQLEQIEDLVDEGEFPNRSEALRAAVREIVADAPNQDVVAGETASVEFTEVSD